MRVLLAGFLLVLLVGCGPAAQPTPTPAPSPAAPTRTSAPTPTATKVPTPALTAVAICNTGGIGAYVRKDPKGAGIVAWPDGTVLEIIGPDQTVDGEVWRNVRDERGNSGWTKKDYLCETSPLRTPAGTLLTPAPTRPISLPTPP